MYKAVLFTIVHAIAASAAPADNYVHLDPVNEFSLSLLQNVYAFQDNFGQQNFAVSPISAWNVFSLLSEGASGTTFDELSQLLRLPKDSAVTQSLHKATDKVLQKDNKDVVLKKQAAMFAERSLRIHQDFCLSAARHNTDIYTVNSTNTRKLTNDINYYICLATDGRIKDAINEDFLQDLRLLLVDVMYFKANWTNPFIVSDTRKEPFFDQQGRNIGHVNMMHQKALNKLVDLPNLEADMLELTYGDSKEFSMIILVPYNGVPLKRLLNNLIAQPTNTWIKQLTEREQTNEVDCYVPKFKISSQLDLVQPLKFMGLYSIFDIMKAELPGIADEPLFVSKTIQKVELEVTEEGTVASVATVVGLENRILGPTIEVNRPFAYMVMERKSNVILFAGVYAVPNID